MKHLLFIFLCHTILLQALVKPDFTAIDEASKSTPENLKTYQEIASHLTYNLDSDIEKARAIYIWISHNIKYDFAIDINNFVYKYDMQMVDEAIEKRKGVCQHYSDLYAAMARYVGLECYVISGYTKDFRGKLSDGSHAWNLLKTDSTYAFIDATWAAGSMLDDTYKYEFNDQYFLIHPYFFIAHHMPFDPIWQCLDVPLSHQEFIDAHLSKRDSSGHYPYPSEIQKYSQQNKLEQYQRSQSRIKASGVSSALIRRKVDELTQLINNEIYNNTVTIMNEAISAYNSYIDLKNSKTYHPKSEKNRMKELIMKAENGIYQSQSNLKQLKTNDHQLRTLSSDALAQIEEIIPYLKKEKKFLYRYD